MHPLSTKFNIDPGDPIKSHVLMMPNSLKKRRDSQNVTAEL